MTASKETLTDKERTAWKECLRRIDFAAEMCEAKSDKTLVKDSMTKMTDAIEKFKPIFRQRAAMEMTK